jgi:tetratricopeptide (TPR) repeat protein
MTRKDLRIAVIVAVLIAAGPALGAGQPEESLTAARELYATAAYRDALAMLDALKARRPTGDEAIEVEKYRVFCLLALGRTTDAQEAIVAILAARPGFRLAEEDVSRRIVAAFDETRRRTLPDLVQRAYQRGKQAYDRQQFEQARTQFHLVLALADDPDIPADAALARDARTLASAFLDLIGVNVPPLLSTALAFAVPVAPATKLVYGNDDEGIVPPVVVEQRLPPWPPSLRTAPGARAVVELMIDEKGAVESAVMAPPFNSPYDELLLAAARTWRYRPALCGQQPVKFRRRVQVVAGAEHPGPGR